MLKEDKSTELVESEKVKENTSLNRIKTDKSMMQYVKTEYKLFLF